MKAKLLFPLSFLCSSLFWLNSCNKEDVPASAGHYSEGLFVINEGPFGGTGTITWHNPQTGETVQDVFGKANGNAALGEFVQSLTLHNGKGYIAVTNANKVYVVDALSFKFLDTISGLVKPRYMLPLDNQTALISQWGANGLNGSVAKIDLQTLDIIQTIPTGLGPDKLFRQADGLVVVPNSGGFGVDSTISILNLGNTAELDRKTVPGKNPGSGAVAQFISGPLGAATMIHCRGYYQDTPPQGWVGPLSAVFGGGDFIPPDGDDLVAAPDGKALYFTAGGKIYTLDKNGLRVLFEQNAWGLACAPQTGYLYCCDARDFNSAGEVVVYKPTGEKVASFTAGITPGEVVFIQ